MARTSKRKAVVGHPESTAANIPDDVRANLDSRLARVEGHVAAIRRMLAAGDDCDALLVQTSAVRSALSAVLVGLMEAHLTSCVEPCTRSGNSDEAMGRFRQALKTVLKGA
jgi:DNA-binding FrmR family transcriptional regulator